MAAQAIPGAGLLKGLGVTIKHMFKPAVTQQYPHVRPELPPRTRGVIALMDENCTVCMLCARECPDWCIYIDSHKETVPPAKEGGRARTRNVLDRFAIDFALCMYCGICVEVCPFDALFWSPEFEYAEYAIGGLLHEMPKLREWMDTVPPPPALDSGAESVAEVADAIEKVQKELEAAQAAQEQKAEVAAPPAKAEGGGGAAAPTKKAEEPIEVEAGEIDQETFDKLIAEGKSERMARAKAKAAYVRKRKAEIRAEREADGGGDEPSAPATPAEGDTPAEAATAEEAPAPSPTEAPAPSPAEAPAPSPAEAPAPKKAEVHIEAGEIDQETYDALIAEGKSERIARSKAKAAYVRKKRKELSDGGEE